MVRSCYQVFSSSSLKHEQTAANPSSSETPLAVLVISHQLTGSLRSISAFRSLHQRFDHSPPVYSAADPISQEYFLGLPPAPYKLPGFHVSTLPKNRSCLIYRIFSGDINIIENSSTVYTDINPSCSYRWKARNSAVFWDALFGKDIILQKTFRTCRLRACQSRYPQIPRQMY